MLHSARILADACEKLRLYSIEGTTPDTDRISAYVNKSLMLVTALSPVIGYDKASAIAHKAQDEGTTLRDAAVKSGAIRAEDFDTIVVPAQMVGNPRHDLGLARGSGGVAPATTAGDGRQFPSGPVASRRNQS